MYDKSAYYSDELMEFLNRSVVNFYAVDTVRHRLELEGFVRLDPRDAWTLEKGGRYYMTCILYTSDASSK